MGQGNSDRVVDFCRAGEGGIEILPVELAHDLEADLARNLPVEFPAGELAGCLAPDMDGEGRRAHMEELLGVVVGEDDPEIGFQRTQLCAHFRRDLAHVRDDRLVLGLRHGEELGRMGQHGAADHGGHHHYFSLAAALPAAIFSPKLSLDAGANKARKLRSFPNGVSNKLRSFPRQRESRAKARVPAFAGTNGVNNKQQAPLIPAQAGIQGQGLGPRVRGDERSKQQTTNSAHSRASGNPGPRPGSPLSRGRTE